MGSSDGEAVSVPELGGSGGCRAYQGGDAGCAVAPLRRVMRRREPDLETVCLIGQGSAALVYLVRSRRTGKMSALKVQRKGDHLRSVERVHMERDILVKARHPLVAKLHSAFQDPLYLYLQMEYCPGGSLDHFVWNILRRNLTEDEARFYVAEVTVGLEFLHSRGFVYRDLKAANVLVAASGHVKLTDFGIAERGRLSFCTNDRVDAEACGGLKSLSRTQSTPGFGQMGHVNGARLTSSVANPPVAQPLPTAPPQVSLKGYGCSGATAGRRLGSLENLRGLMKTPPRGVNAHRRSATVDGVLPGSGKPVKLDDAASTPRATSPPVASTTPAWRAQSKGSTVSTASASASVATTPSRPVSLRSRLRDRFMRPIRHAALGSVSCSELSLLSSEREPLAAEREQRGGVRAHMDGGDPGRLGAAWKSFLRGEDSARRGDELSPCGAGGLPSHDVSRRRGGCPTLDEDGKTRQAIVTLDEASWYNSSGSPEYMAPEVLMHTAQGSAVDWWGLGILTYELLVGRTPFAGEGGKTRYTYLNIMHKEVQFPDNEEEPRVEVSTDCQEFVRSLLAKDPRERAGSRGSHTVKTHPFLSGVCWEGLLEQEPPLIPGDIDRECLSRPTPVENTSGWSWAAEDAEAEAREVLGSSAASTSSSPFDRFDWIDAAEEEGDPCPSDLSEYAQPKAPIAGVLSARGDAVAAMAVAAVGSGVFGSPRGPLMTRGLRARVFQTDAISLG